MFQALLICFREGLEAFLIVAIAALFLRKAHNTSLLGALRLGVTTSLLGCAVLGVVLARIGEMSPTWAGVMALVAAAAVVWCVVHMMHAGKGMGKEITDRLSEIAALHGPQAWWSVFVFTVFMISREGVEAATMIASLAVNAEGWDMAIGGALGLVLAGAISLMWVRYGHKVNLGRFFRVTAWFMVIFAIQLVVYALHEFSEAGVVPGVDNAVLHIMTEDLAEGWIAQVISVALVVVPTAWLAAAHFKDQMTLRQSEV
jgi:high-affinity iron transporter